MTIESAEGVAFSDLAATNEDLLWAVGDLYEQCVDDPAWRGVLSLDGEGLRVARVWDDGTFGGYDRDTDVWGWWSRDADTVISRGLASGRIELSFEGRGRPARSVITPGAVA